MEILQFLLSFLLESKYGEKLKPLINLFQNNSFDLKSVLNNINLEAIAPLLKEFMSTMNNNGPTETVGPIDGLNPIANIADKDIVFALNKYLSHTV